MEKRVISFAEERKTSGWEACVVKPGLINSSNRLFWSALVRTVGMVGAPVVEVTECAAAMIDQVMNGFEKEPLECSDLARLGRKALGEDAKA